MDTVGTTVLVVVDVQGGEDPLGPTRSQIPVMPGGGAARLEAVTGVVQRCRERGVPVVFVQEVHQPTLVDIGREMDGAEGVHCLEGWEENEVASVLGRRDDEYLVRKRRYSSFFGTDLEIVLKGYGAQTLLLVGGLTDVCVHYTAVDAHQHDYRFRVLTDCVVGSSRRAHDASLEAMAYLQRDALVTSAEVHDWLAALPALGVVPV